ncbi:MAG: hypothetical protein CBC13_04265 [Planctomycetia bacterium TMED53]|nr:MAG: hypothetical protein CBC13_04265 [Planctomycetia bacterium TMED53]
MKCILFPALIPDLLARTLTCLATATPINGMSPWRDGEPLLLEGDCRVQRLALPLGSFLRLSALVGASLFCVLKFPQLSAVVPSPESLEFAAQRGPGAFFHSLGNSFSGVATLDMPALLVVVALAAMVLAAGLRTREAMAGALAGVGVVGVFFFAEWIGFRLGVFSNGWFLQRFYEAEFGKALIVLTLLSLLVTGTLMLLYAVPASVGRLRPRPVSTRGHVLTQS